MTKIGRHVRDNQKHLGGYTKGGNITSMSPPVWDSIIKLFKPSTMIDIGCGEGHAMEYFLKKNIISIGVDGCKETLKDSNIPHLISIWDFSKGPFVTDQLFDLGWCCEFVEHVEEQYTDNFIELFKKCKVVAMTHAIPGQTGLHHVNCQNSDYWIDKMEANNFGYEKDLSLHLRSLNSKSKKEIGFLVGRTLMLFINKELIV